MTAFNNSIQAAMAFNRISGVTNDGSSSRLDMSLLDLAPECDVYASNNETREQVRGLLKEMSQRTGRKFEYDETKLTDTPLLVKSMQKQNPDGINLVEALEEMSAKHIVTKKLLPSLDSLEKLRKGEMNPKDPILMEDYLFVSDALMIDPSIDFQNNKVVQFFAKLARESGVDQFIFPQFHKKINSTTGKAGNLLLFGGYKVVKLLDTKLNKKEIFQIIDDPESDISNLIRVFGDYSKLGIEQVFNNGKANGSNLIGQVPARDETTWTESQYSEAANFYSDQVGYKIENEDGENSPKKPVRIEDKLEKDPLKIIERFIDPRMAEEDKASIFAQKWHWKPDGSQEDPTPLLLLCRTETGVNRNRILSLFDRFLDTDQITVRGLRSDIDGDPDAVDDWS